LTIYEFGEENGVHFLAAEFVKGKTLRQSLGTGNRWRITAQLISAAGVYHLWNERCDRETEARLLRLTPI
jgi:TolB-like protein